MSVLGELLGDRVAMTASGVMGVVPGGRAHWRPGSHR